MNLQKPTKTHKPLKILLIAYACEPDSGSEPGTGWNTALSLAKRNEVTVATRANNRIPVEAALARIDEEKRPSFLFLDPPAWTLRLKSRRIMPTQIFYYFWQREVARQLRSSGECYEVLHQITFNSFEVPPMAFHDLSGAKVWGPIGGGQTAPEGLIDCFGPEGTRKERWRNRRVRLSAKSPWVRKALHCSDHVFFANAETHALLGAHCEGKSGLMIDVGVDIKKFSPGTESPKGSGVTFLAAGRLDPRKGISLIIEAFAELESDCPDAHLLIVGDGPERSRLESIVAAHGLDERITLTGVVGHEMMRRSFETADVFVFPSLRDTSGAVVLEAMAMSLPVVCLDHQGGAQMVGDDRGLRVSVGSHKATINGLRDAMIHLAKNSGLRHELGKNAQEWVAANYDWSIKAAKFEAIYHELLSRNSTNAGSQQSSTT